MGFFEFIGIVLAVIILFIPYAIWHDKKYFLIDRYISFYKKCIEKGITDLNVTDAKKKMKEIAQSESIPFYVKNLNKAYEYGKKLTEDKFYRDELKKEGKNGQKFVLIIFAVIFSVFLFQCDGGKDCSICGHSASKSFNGRSFCSACYWDYKDVYHSYGGR